MATLRQLRDDSAALLLERMEGFRPGAEREALLDDLQEITLRLHIIAVATLLVDGNARKFLLNLVRVAENGLRIHRLLSRRGMELPPASWTTPLLAAVAAGDASRAAALAAAGRRTQAVEHQEYEDEWRWGLLWQALAGGPFPAAEEIERLAGAVEKACPEPYAERLEVVRALAAGDGDRFAGAIQAAHDARAAELDEADHALTSPTRLAPNRRLWLEGLAFLRLGAWRGLAVDDLRLRLCPPLARQLLAEEYDGDWAVDVGSQDA